MRAPFLIVAPALALALAVPAYAGSLGPKRPSDILTLSHGTSGTSACSNAEFDSAVGVDGMLVPFSVPKGQVFVVTEVSGYSPSGGGFVPFLISGTLGHHGAVPSFTGDNFRYVMSPIPVKGVICTGMNPAAGSVALHGFLAKDK